MTFPNLFSDVRRYVLKYPEFKIMLGKLVAKSIKLFLYIMCLVAIAACPPVSDVRSQVPSGLGNLTIDIMYVVSCKM